VSAVVQLCCISSSDLNFCHLKAVKQIFDLPKTFTVHALNLFIDCDMSAEMIIRVKTVSRVCLM